MSTEQPQVSILDARLAEIDDRLRTIQDGLTEDGLEGGSGSAPAPTFVPVSGVAAVPAPALADDVVDELRALAGTQERLLHAVRELVRAHAPAAGGDDPSRLGLSVGPLRDPEELRAFERAVSELPGVDAVALRGYEGGDRAVLDVQLRPTS